MHYTSQSIIKSRRQVAHLF